MPTDWYSITEPSASKKARLLHSSHIREPSGKIGRPLGDAERQRRGQDGQCLPKTQSASSAGKRSVIRDADEGTGSLPNRRA